MNEGKLIFEATEEPKHITTLKYYFWDKVNSGVFPNKKVFLTKEVLRDVLVRYFAHNFSLMNQKETTWRGIQVPKAVLCVGKILEKVDAEELKKLRKQIKETENNELKDTLTIQQMELVFQAMRDLLDDTEYSTKFVYESNIVRTILGLAPSGVQEKKDVAE